MTNIIKMIFGMCWDILGIEIQLYEYTITLRQVLLFAVLAYGVATMVFYLVFNRFGGGGE